MTDSAPVPKAFISYAHEDAEHRGWVRTLAARLRADGVEVHLDQWHLAPGDQLPEFMERAVRDNDYVLIVCTPRYREKSDGRAGGVGYEGDIMTGEVITTGNDRKFIPILRRGTWLEAAPSWLSGKYRIDLADTPYDESQYRLLLATLHDAREPAPPVGRRPTFTAPCRDPDHWTLVRQHCQRLSERFSAMRLFVPEPERGHTAGTPAAASTLGNGFIPLHLARCQQQAAPHPLPIDEVFFSPGQYQHCLVRGLAGTGKTTLLRYLAHRYAQDTAEGRHDLVPIYIHLKNVNDRGGGPLDLEWLLAFIREEIDGQVESVELAGFLGAGERLREGTLALLLDGLDEVEGSTFEHLVAALRDLRQRCPRCRVVITSRPVGLGVGRFPRFEEVELLPLQDELIQSYLVRRFEYLPGAAERLRVLFRTHSRIGSLATNPFLLSMICSTHETLGDVETIQSRSELYERCTSHLIQRLYEPGGDRPLLSYEHTLAMLKDLSLRFFLWQEPDFPVSHVSVMASRTLPAEVIGRTEEFLDELQKRSGLIQRSRSGYSFVHRSLWEYFTALALQDRRPEFLLRQAANPDWDEVVRLYAGLSMGRGAFSRDLVEGLWL
ncbi:MAG TPA: TIR domain-containing protein, partial [Longimicrobium sp.]|nr:TIR domain-containing protein [Longimicrobium sp.]